MIKTKVSMHGLEGLKIVRLGKEGDRESDPVPKSHVNKHMKCFGTSQISSCYA